MKGCSWRNLALATIVPWEPSTGRYLSAAEKVSAQPEGYLLTTEASNSISERINFAIPELTTPRSTCASSCGTSFINLERYAERSAVTYEHFSRCPTPEFELTVPNLVSRIITSSFLTNSERLDRIRGNETNGWSSSFGNEELSNEFRLHEDNKPRYLMGVERFKAIDASDAYDIAKHIPISVLEELGAIKNGRISVKQGLLVDAARKYAYKFRHSAPGEMFLTFSHVFAAEQMIAKSKKARDDRKKREVIENHKIENNGNSPVCGLVFEDDVASNIGLLNLRSIEEYTEEVFGHPRVPTVRYLLHNLPFKEIYLATQRMKYCNGKNDTAESPFNSLKQCHYYEMGFDDILITSEKKAKTYGTVGLLWGETGTKALKKLFQEGEVGKRAHCYRKVSCVPDLLFRLLKGSGLISPAYVTVRFGEDNTGVRKSRNSHGMDSKTKNTGKSEKWWGHHRANTWSMSMSWFAFEWRQYVASNIRSRMSDAAVQEGLTSIILKASNLILSKEKSTGLQADSVNDINANISDNIPSLHQRISQVVSKLYHSPSNNNIRRTADSSSAPDVWNDLSWFYDMHWMPNKYSIKFGSLKNRRRLQEQNDDENIPPNVQEEEEDRRDMNPENKNNENEEENDSLDKNRVRDVANEEVNEDERNREEVKNEQEEVEDNNNNIQNNEENNPPLGNPNELNVVQAEEMDDGHNKPRDSPENEKQEVQEVQSMEQPAEIDSVENDQPINERPKEEDQNMAEHRFNLSPKSSARVKKSKKKKSNLESNNIKSPDEIQTPRELKSNRDAAEKMNHNILPNMNRMRFPSVGNYNPRLRLPISAHYVQSQIHSSANMTSGLVKHNANQIRPHVFFRNWYVSYGFLKLNLPPSDIKKLYETQTGYKISLDQLVAHVESLRAYAQVMLPQKGIEWIERYSGSATVGGSKYVSNAPFSRTTSATKISNDDFYSNDGRNLMILENVLVRSVMRMAQQKEFRSLGRPVKLSATRYVTGKINNNNNVNNNNNINVTIHESNKTNAVLNDSRVQADDENCLLEDSKDENDQPRRNCGNLVPSLIFYDLKKRFLERPMILWTPSVIVTDELQLESLDNEMLFGPPPFN